MNDDDFDLVVVGVLMMTLVFLCAIGMVIDWALK